MKVVINTCFGGFGLSTAAYEWLAANGIPVRKYIEEPRGDDGLYQKVPENEGRVIFDRELTQPGEESFSDIYHKFKKSSRFARRYWDTWTARDRADPLIVRLVEELGDRANGECAKLKIVEIPDGVKWHIDEYDGDEHVAEDHRTWRE